MIVYRTVTPVARRDEPTPQNRIIALKLAAVMSMRFVWKEEVLPKMGSSPGPGRRSLQITPNNQMTWTTNSRFKVSCQRSVRLSDSVII